MDQYRGKKRQLNMLLISNGALSTCIFFNSFIVMSDWGGLNEFLTSAAYLGYCFAAIVLLNHNPSAFSIGMLLGSSIILAIFTFLNTLFWAVSSSYIDDHPIAAIFATLFNFIFFVIECYFIILLYKSKRQLIDMYSPYDYIPECADAPLASRSHCESDDTFSIHSYQSTSQQAPPTADI